jgi:hypothetical protein
MRQNQLSFYLSLIQKDFKKIFKNEEKKETPFTEIPILPGNRSLKSEGIQMQGRFFQRFAYKQALFSILLIGFSIYYLIPNLLCAQPKKQQRLYQDLFSVTFPTEQDGWACGRWGTILYSGDRGKSWVRQSSGTDYT